MRGAAALAALACPAAGAGREEVPFDFGWRAAAGTDPVHPPAPPPPPPPPVPPVLACTDPSTGFPYNRSGVQCFGLTHDFAAKGADQCAQHCCSDKTCDVWQFEAGGGSGTGCWRGLALACGRRVDGVWVGGSKMAPAPPPTPAPPTPAPPRTPSPVTSAPPTASTAAPPGHSTGWAAAAAAFPITAAAAAWWLCRRRRKHRWAPLPTVDHLVVNDSPGSFRQRGGGGPPRRPLLTPTPHDSYDPNSPGPAGRRPPYDARSYDPNSPGPTPADARAESGDGGRAESGDGRSAPAPKAATDATATCQVASSLSTDYAAMCRGVSRVPDSA